MHSWLCLVRVPSKGGGERVFRPRAPRPQCVLFVTANTLNLTASDTHLGAVRTCPACAARLCCHTSAPTLSHLQEIGQLYTAPLGLKVAHASDGEYLLVIGTFFSQHPKLVSPSHKKRAWRHARSHHTAQLCTDTKLRCMSKPVMSAGRRAGLMVCVCVRAGSQVSHISNTSSQENETRILQIPWNRPIPARLPPQTTTPHLVQVRSEGGMHRAAAHTHQRHAGKHRIQPSPGCRIHIVSKPNRTARKERDRGQT